MHGIKLIVLLAILNLICSLVGYSLCAKLTGDFLGFQDVAIDIWEMRERLHSEEGGGALQNKHDVYELQFAHKEKYNALSQDVMFFKIMFIGSAVCSIGIVVAGWRSLRRAGKK